MGLPYYPKLLVGVPFTPAGGARVLIDPMLDDDMRKNIRTTVAMFLRYDTGMTLHFPSVSFNRNVYSGQGFRPMVEDSRMIWLTSRRANRSGGLLPF